MESRGEMGDKTNFLVTLVDSEKNEAQNVSSNEAL